VLGEQFFRPRDVVRGEVGQVLVPRESQFYPAEAAALGSQERFLKILCHFIGDYAKLELLQVRRPRRNAAEQRCRRSPGHKFSPPHVASSARIHASFRPDARQSMELENWEERETHARIRGPERDSGRK
jgi:hypothetical protein